MADPKPWINDKNIDEVCESLPSMFKNGESVAEVCVKIGIARSTFYANIEKHQKLKEAYELGKLYSEAWWQKLGRAGAAGQVSIQPTVFIANMNNRFGWGENMRLQHTSPDLSMSPGGFDVKKYKEAQAELSKTDLSDLD